MPLIGFSRSNPSKCKLNPKSSVVFGYWSCKIKAFASADNDLKARPLIHADIVCTTITFSRTFRFSTSHKSAFQGESTAFLPPAQQFAGLVLNHASADLDLPPIPRPFFLFTFCLSKCLWAANRRNARWITRANPSNLRSLASSSRNSDSGFRTNILVRPSRNSVPASSADRQISSHPFLQNHQLFSPI